MFAIGTRRLRPPPPTDRGSDRIPDREGPAPPRGSPLHSPRHPQLPRVRNRTLTRGTTAVRRFVTLVQTALECCGEVSFHTVKVKNLEERYFALLAEVAMLSASPPTLVDGVEGPKISFTREQVNTMLGYIAIWVQR